MARRRPASTQQLGTRREAWVSSAASSAPRATWRVPPPSGRGGASSPRVALSSASGVNSGGRGTSDTAWCCRSPRASSRLPRTQSASVRARGSVVPSARRPAGGGDRHLHRAHRVPLHRPAVEQRASLALREAELERRCCRSRHHVDHTPTARAVPCGGRSSPVTAGSRGQETPALAGNSGWEPAVLVASYRPVTPEVAGSSPVAPVSLSDPWKLSIGRWLDLRRVITRGRTSSEWSGWPTISLRPRCWMETHGSRLATPSGSTAASEDWASLMTCFGRCAPAERPFLSVARLGSASRRSSLSSRTEPNSAACVLWVRPGSSPRRSAICRAVHAADAGDRPDRRSPRPATRSTFCGVRVAEGVAPNGFLIALAALELVTELAGESPGISARRGRPLVGHCKRRRAGLSGAADRARAGGDRLRSPRRH